MVSVAALTASAPAPNPTVTECGAWPQPALSVALQVAALNTEMVLGLPSPPPLGGAVATYRVPVAGLDHGKDHWRRSGSQGRQPDSLPKVPPQRSRRM